jgi:FkbM family methyltransferase
MHRIFKIIFNKIYRVFINYGIVRNKYFQVNDKKILFHSLRKNNLLKNICIYGFESHENEVIKLIKNYHWDLDYFFDIGSNIGHYAAIACAYHKKSEVIAVEPFPLNAEYIRQLKNNNDMKFTIVQRAVDSISDQEKTFYFPISKGSSKLPATGTLINSFKGSGGIFNSLPFKTVEVKTISLDDLVQSCNGNALIKIDCEGNEFNILNGSATILKDNVDFIVEIMINDNDKNELFTLMEDNGYNGYLITNAGLVKENRPLTLPKPDRNDRTLWRNHFFTKKSVSEIKKFSIEHYGYWI